MIHHTHPALLEHFDITLIGAGGNGSQMLTCLGRLHHAMTALGHPGFDVTVWDPDTVSTANVGRQMFSPADVGANKAATLVTRVNAFFGLDWRARAARWSAIGGDGAALMIVCVDSRASRAEIARTPCWVGPGYVLDLGNRADDGQVLLGQFDPERNNRRAGARRDAPRLPDHVDLPSPYALLPELIDTTQPEDDAPSCSLAEALERQSLFVNDDVTRVAALLLWHLLRHGRLTWHGAFVNAATGRRVPVAVDPDAWQRMGVRPGKGKR